MLTELRRMDKDNHDKAKEAEEERGAGGEEKGEEAGRKRKRRKRWRENIKI